MAIYIIGYGVARFFIEYVRQPDIGMEFPIQLVELTKPAIQFSPFNFTTGQILNFIMFLIGGATGLGVLLAVLGVVLLGLYYMARPSLFVPQGGVAEGSYLIVNKNLVELFALFVTLLFPTGRLIGLDRLIWWMRNPEPPASVAAEKYA